MPYAKEYDFQGLTKKRLKKLQLGDIINYSEYRHSKSVFIGPDGVSIANPDNSNSGFLTIPLEISQHFKNAVEFFKNIDYYDIEVSHTDEFLTKHVKQIDKSVKYTLCNKSLWLEYPNNIFKEIKIEKIKYSKV